MNKDIVVWLPRIILIVLVFIGLIYIGVLS